MAAEQRDVTTSQGASTWRSFQRTALSVRLAVFSAALAALVIFGTFAALSIRIRSSTRRLFAEELTRNGKTLVGLQRESRRQLVLTAALIAESPTLKSAMSTEQVERQSGGRVRTDLIPTVERELQHLASTLPGGVLLATDEKGKVFAAYVRDSTVSADGFDLSHLAAVRNALDATMVTTTDEPYLAALELGPDFYKVGVVPLIVSDFTVGSIVFGERVDSAAVAALRRDFEGEVVISAGSKIISSTLPADQALVAAREPGETAHAVRLGANEYLAAVVPLGRTQRDTPLRITLLQPLTPTVQLLTAALRRDFLLYGALAVILAALGAAVLSRSLLRPLVGFIKYIRRGAEGEGIDEEFQASEASQEIRVLNESFNRLMSSLRGKREELERRGEELTSANEVLTEEIRQRERVEQALRESEAQLRQSQKLEAIGTLAGGIAHDFNNMLTVISGFTQLAMGSLPKDHDVIQDLKQVADAANSAAGLTHQLLAFSRKQVLQPRVLDIEHVVVGMEGMLRRIIGTHIVLYVSHEGESARVKADPGQLEQVLLNLAVNARDAMPSGGNLLIRTGHRANGRVTLSVRDTGIGMSSEVRDRIFEPFFTTKEIGKGTGLGLSTVYGIVAQSGGTVEVESTPGAGTTFTVVLPPIAESVTATDGSEDDAELPRGTETVLIVDDEEAVLDMARRTLEGCGYTVIAAHGGVEALTSAAQGRRVDVLVTDVIMPQLSGPQLVERYLAKYPAPCIIYVTGYVDDETMRMELDEEVTLLRKPFSPLELARTVRAVLDIHLAHATVSQ